MTAPAKSDAQLGATDPSASAWVTANAGSGKTYILTRRVIRLLLAGCEPSRILCLTFTKAAAAEMANRVFDLLGTWAILPEDELAKSLAEVEGAPPDRLRIAEARRLFARALETPGGLKIQTIHAFCEALLQRFAVEADLPGRFEVLDDRRAAAFEAEARAAAIREAAAAPGTPLGEALSLLLARCTDLSVDAAVSAFLRRREAFLAFVRRFDHLDEALASLPGALGVPPGRTRADLVAECATSPHFGADVLGALLPELARGSATMTKLADGFAAAGAEPDPTRRAALWRTLFLTREHTPKKTPVTNDIEAALPGTRDLFAAEAARLLALEGALLAHDTATMTAAAARIADRVIGHYQALKRTAGALDFDDLIQRAVALLSRSDAADWVQYKLDEGLDHVLVDEAQDTSPLQWQIVTALTGDFFTGRGARGTTVRTVFAVGDEKQSIYSFQNAAPRLFADSGNRFERLALGAGATFHAVRLTVSRRSTPEVVKAVDRVFEPVHAHTGLSRDPERTIHETTRHAEPGLVEVWPEIEAEESPRPARWEDPVDRTGPGSPDLRLAARIATEIRRWIDDGACIEATGKPIRPGDVIVLVRKRGPFVEALNRALMAHGVPVAGADRLDVVGHVIAQDLLAAARVALLPDDDLTLAAFARSPLVPAAEPGGPTGLCEEALFRLAHDRGDASLWDRARDLARRGDPDAARLAGRVETLLARADRSDPFRFFAALVGEDGGRASVRARMGREADEVVDEFLAMVLAAEDRGADSLAAVIALMADARDDIRREMDAGRDEVRVMTVHGSKGLEAPVVFLVDPGSPPAAAHHDPVVTTLGEEPGAPPVWIQPGRKPPAVEVALAEHRRTQAEEYRRLLYVGLTRARDRLIVCGTRTGRSLPEGRWHTLVSEALRRDAIEVPGEDGTVQRWEWRCPPVRPAKTLARSADPAPDPAPVPAFLARPTPAASAVRPLTPSAAAAILEPADPPVGSRRAGPDALARARGAEEAPVRRGHLVHRLIELLPGVPTDLQAARAGAYLDRSAADLTAADRQAILASVMGVLDDARFASVFAPGSRAEVAVAGTLPVEGGPGIPVFGQVDRLVHGPDGILVVDFKTGRAVPNAVPLAYATQLALYRALLMRLHPGVPVRAAILWTEAPRFDEVSAADLDALVTRLVTNMGTYAPATRS